MAKKKTNKKQPWSNSLEYRESLYKGVNPSADFDPISLGTQLVGYLGGFRTGQGMPEDEARWAAYLGLPYDKTYAPDSKIRFEGDEKYPDRQYQGLSKRAKEEVREEIIPKARRIKNKYNKEWIQVLDTKPNSEYNDATIYHDRQNYLGDLGKFGIREVGNSGIYEVGDKYDFPSWVPVPDRNEGTELMVRDTIWSDRANPKLYEEELLRRSNKHSLGGWFAGLGSKLDGINSNLTDKFFNSKLGKGLEGFGIKSGNIGGSANTAATAIGGLFVGKNTTGVGKAMQGIGSLASSIPGVGGLIGAGVNLAGGLVNAAFGSNLNQEFIDQTEQAAKQQANYVSSASTNAQLMSDYANMSLLSDVNKDDVGSDGWFSNKASDETERLNALTDDANAKAMASIQKTADNIDKQNDLGLMANYTAYGGPINMKYKGVMSPFGNQFKEGGIYIKPSKRGTFTTAAKKRGMGVQEFASKVLANKEDYSSAMVKKANFARNASKWKHADGGNLFTNGVTIIGNGGTHEQSPLEGVPMGVDNQGIPNLVEEEEVIFNDYVFSNRLRVPKEVRQKYKLRGVTFADASKQLQKESEERPNDSIAKNTLNSIMSELTQVQEEIRMKKNNNKYAKGGKLGRVYEGEGGDPNWLYKPITQGFTPSKADIIAEMESMYPSLLGESTLPIASKIKGSTSFKDQLGIKGEEQSSKVAPMKTHWLRYTPSIGSSLAVMNDLFGGNEPDYSNTSMFERAIEGTNKPVTFTPLFDYMAYKPVDIERYKNRLDANAAASRRYIRNNSGGNRAAYLTGVLSSDYNYGNQLGELMGNIEGINYSRYKDMKSYNKATNLTNAEMAMKADMANAEQGMQRARMYGSLAEYRDKILAANRAEKSANLTNFIQGLGDLGTELTDKDKLRWLADRGVLAYNPSGEYTGSKTTKKKDKERKYGGKLNKKRGGFTI